MLGLIGFCPEEKQLRLCSSRVEVSPAIWTGHFMKEWDTFWSRDHDDGSTEGMDALFGHGSPVCLPLNLKPLVAKFYMKPFEVLKRCLLLLFWCPGALLHAQCLSYLGQ